MEQSDHQENPAYFQSVWADRPTGHSNKGTTSGVFRCLADSPQLVEIALEKIDQDQMATQQAQDEPHYKPVEDHNSIV